MDVETYKSTDGGHLFDRIRVPHGDNHGLWIDPRDTRRMIAANDGGVTVTLDGGKTWTLENNQPTAQFYHVITDNATPYRVYGSQQDSGTVAIASRSDDGSIDRSDWYDVGGGEAGYIAPYPLDPNIVYADDYQGTLTRYDRHIGQVKSITEQPELSDAHGAANLEHRFQWTAPVLISPHDPNTLYHAGERLFKTTDAGVRWQTISPDLTRNDKSKQNCFWRRYHTRRFWNRILRHDLCGSRIPGHERCVVGGDRRRSDPTDARRRENVDEHYPKGFARVEPHQPDRSVSVRCRQRLCRRGSASERRSETLHI